MTELMVPSYANFGGKVHGGILLRLMDQVAYATASKHAGTYCVTVSIHGVHFRAPVEVGNLVSMRASVNYVGQTSMLVGIHVDAEDVSTSEVRHTNTSYFWMVAKNEDGSSAEVPGLILETREDLRRCLEAIKRRELTARYDSKFDNARSGLALAKEIPSLDHHRVRLAADFDQTTL